MAKCYLCNQEITENNRSVEHIIINANDSSKDLPCKVFISHAGEDIEFAEKLVSLLESLGIDSRDKMLCSSVDGYRIPEGEDFAEYILKQFREFNLFVIFILSRNYYNSPYCLNEMGAAWVLKSNSISILTRGFDYLEISGFINNREISIKVDATDAKSRLNELKNKLVPLFKPEGVDENRWENKRDAFLSAVCSMQPSDIIPRTQNKGVDIFDRCYIPHLETIFNFVDSKKHPFCCWTARWVVAGSPRISKEQYENLESLERLLLRIAPHPECGWLDSLLGNLHELVKDYIFVSDHYMEIHGNVCYVETFYKSSPHNPHYDEQLERYNEYVFLIYDMTFELARLLNYILERVRSSYQPDFMNERGIMVIGNEKRESVLYQESEKCDAPYPGLKDFLRERKKRLCYLGNEEDLKKIL